MTDYNTYYPDDQIAQQYKLADVLRAQRPGTGSSWAGIIGNALGTVGGNLVQGGANNALQSNQALRNKSLQDVGSATDVPSLSKALLNSPVPEIQNLGLKTQIQQVTDDPNKEYRVRAAQAIKYGLKPGTAEFNRFVLTNKMSDPNENGAFGKAGTIVQGSDGSFYSIQFGAGGQRKIEKLEIGGTPAPNSAVQSESATGVGTSANGVAPAPAPAPIALTPSRGVDVQGNLMYDKATGKSVRDVGSNLAEGERQKKIGAGMAEGQLSLPKSRIALEQYEIQDNVVQKSIDKAITQANGWTTGVAGSLLKDLPQTDAHNLQNTLNTIKSNLGFDKLQAMRDASPTGGALGQVSEMENRLLQSVWGSVEQSQTKEQLLENLAMVKQIREQYRDLKRRAYEQDVARFGAANVPNPETGQIPNDKRATISGRWRVSG